MCTAHGKCGHRVENDREQSINMQSDAQCAIERVLVSVFTALHKYSQKRCGIETPVERCQKLFKFISRFLFYLLLVFRVSAVVSGLFQFGFCCCLLDILLFLWQHSPHDWVPT